METMLRVKKDGCFEIPEIAKTGFAKAGEKLAVLRNDSTIIIKKMQPANTVHDFDVTAQEIRAQLKSRDVSRGDINDAIKWARKRKSN
jgi:hypothetical protein